MLKTGDDQFGDVAEKLAQIADNRLNFDKELEPDSPGKVYSVIQNTITR